eukprot:TRINITY_DN260_c2_g1_i4.p1 TRINITY_DN260_c2_g1~~TRINITY_DN260_c2_g1_i4.p1  ORF type:complete len:704 (+),score=299.01 TRINITY_DN260_c2_g1_i4:268-2379(+)
MGNIPNPVAGRGAAPIPPNGQPFNPNSYTLPGGNKAGDIAERNRLADLYKTHNGSAGMVSNNGHNNAGVVNNTRMMAGGNQGNMPGMHNVNQNPQGNLPTGLSMNPNNQMMSNHMNVNNPNAAGLINQQNINANERYNNQQNAKMHLPINPHTKSVVTNPPSNINTMQPSNMQGAGGNMNPNPTQMPGSLQQFLQAIKGNLTTIFLSLGPRMTGLLPPQMQSQIQLLAQKKAELTNRQKNLKVQSDKLATEAANWQRTQAEYTTKMAEVTQQHRNISSGQPSTMPHPQMNQMRATFQKLAEEKKQIVTKHNYLIESNTSIRQQSSELSDEMLQQQNRQGILDQQLLQYVQQNHHIVIQLQQQLLSMQQQGANLNAMGGNNNNNQGSMPFVGHQQVQPNRPFQGYSNQNMPQNPFLSASEMEASQMGGMNHPSQSSPMYHPPTPQQQPTPQTPSSQQLASPSINHLGEVSSPPPVSSPLSGAVPTGKKAKKSKSKAPLEKKETSKKKKDPLEEEYKEPLSKKEMKEAATGSWSQEEINKLMEAQEQHGPTAYKLISKAVGTRSANQVRTYISKMKKKPSHPPAKKGRGANSNPSTPHVSSSNPTTPHNNNNPMDISPPSFMDNSNGAPIHLSSEGLSNPLSEFPNIPAFDNEGILDFLQEDEFRDLPVPNDLNTITDSTDNLFGLQPDDLLGQEELTNTDEFFA